MNASYFIFRRQFIQVYQPQMIFYVCQYVEDGSQQIVAAVITELIENEYRYRLIEKFDRRDPSLVKTVMVELNRHIRDNRTAC